MEKLTSKLYMEKLSLAYTGIGSLPFSGSSAPNDANDFVFKTCKDFPYWPQLPHYKMEEHMTLQFTEKFAGLSFDKRLHRFYLDDKKDDFLKNLSVLSDDFNKVISSNSIFECEEILNKYNLIPPYSNTFSLFLNTIQNLDDKPNFIKGTITGPFTFLGNFCDAKGKPALFNKTFVEIISKFLTLKALFQIKEFKKAAKDCVPVIFIDEPGLSQIHSYPYSEIAKDKIAEMLKIISDNIKKFDAITGIHCCGCTDWDIVFESGTDIINFDAYFYTKNLAQYTEKIEKFLQNGGYLAFGIIPTLDKEALLGLDKDKLYEKFQNSVEILSDKIDKNFILKQCFITPSCGLGSLDINLANHALNLAKELSQTLRNQTFKKENEVTL